VTERLVLVPITLAAAPSGCRTLDHAEVVTSTAGGSIVVPKGQTAQIIYVPDHGTRSSPTSIGTAYWPTGVRFVVGGLRFAVRSEHSSEVWACP
jgi:hypothetical protein